MMNVIAVNADSIAQYHCISNLGDKSGTRVKAYRFPENEFGTKEKKVYYAARSSPWLNRGCYHCPYNYDTDYNSDNKYICYDIKENFQESSNTPDEFDNFKIDAKSARDCHKWTIDGSSKNDTFFKEGYTQYYKITGSGWLRHCKKLSMEHETPTAFK